MIWAWFIDPKNFVPNALVELGATFLTVGLTALGVDQVIKSRDLYHARQEWRRTRGYALTETCRSLQKIVFACLSFLPERLRNDDQPHSTWDAVQLRNEHQLRSLMDSIALSLTQYISKSDSGTEWKTLLERDIHHMLGWYAENRVTFEDFSARNFPLLNASHCPQETAFAHASMEVQKLSWYFDGLSHACEKRIHTVGDTADFIGQVGRVLSVGRVLHELSCAELNEIDG